MRRVTYIDLAGGILIIWVMVYHAMSMSRAFGGVDPRVALPWLTFSMPWFFYKSGMLFKEIPCREGLTRDFKKLVVPFVRWTLIGYVGWVVIQLIDGTVSAQTCVEGPLNMLYRYGCMSLNIPAWFLLSLFFVRVISRYLLSRSVPAPVVIALCVAIGYSLHLLNHPKVPFPLSNIAMGIAFFMVGNKWGHREGNKWLIAACATGYALFLAFGPSIVGHHRNILLSGHYLLWPLYAYCGIVVFDNLCRWIEGAVAGLSERHGGRTDTVLASDPFRPLRWIGRHTMILLVSHGTIYMSFVHYSTASPWATVGMICLAYVICLAPLLWYDSRKQA